MIFAVPSDPTSLELELALQDPEVVEASYEVDRTLLRWSLQLSPLERLRACTRVTAGLDTLRRGTLTR